MELVHRARQALENAESSLRAFATEAVSAGDYEVAIQLTEWAKQVGLLRKEESEEEPRGLVFSNQPTANSAPSAVSSLIDNALVASPSKRSRPGTSRRKGPSKRRQKKSKYPQFYRRGSELIKVGWSKKAKAEYQHKASREVVALVAKAIADRAAEGSVFDSQGLIPLRDPKSKTEVPGYQVYLCLAWFRSEELVEQEGRQGYRVPSPQNLDQRIAEKWENLTEK